MITIRKITDESEKLDLDSLDRQYFFIERPKSVIRELQDSFEKVEDVTYLNDETPSVLINGLIKMYLPNSIRQNEMENNEYVIIKDDGEGNEDADYYSTDRLDHAIDYIVELLENLSPLEALFKEITEEAAELINLGSSRERAIGIGMGDALLRIKKVLKEIDGKN
jgi:hypothetical protein